jgi:homoserine dehydrogenase
MYVTNNKLTIGLFGFGVVGKGLYDVLHNTPTLNLLFGKYVSKILIKKEPLMLDYFTSDRNDLLFNNEINAHCRTD